MDKDEMYNSRTIRMGKFLDESNPDAEIEIARKLADAFYLDFKVEMFNEEDHWLSIYFTFDKDGLYATEFSSVIKLFALYHNYSILYYSDEVRPTSFGSE